MEFGVRTMRSCGPGVFPRLIVRALPRSATLFFPFPLTISRLSIRASAALLLSFITSAISQIRSFLARCKVSCSSLARLLTRLDSVSDSTRSARSNTDPELNTFDLANSRRCQFLGFPTSFDGSLLVFRWFSSAGISSRGSNARSCRLEELPSGTSNSPSVSSSKVKLQKAADVPQTVL